jgi:hypothetical protein
VKLTTTSGALAQDPAVVPDPCVHVHPPKTAQSACDLTEPQSLHFSVSVT